MTSETKFSVPVMFIGTFYFQHATPQYKYSYHVRNLEGGQHGHHVLRNGQHTEGKYYVKLNDGVSQNVEYYTDQFGYHPKVVYSNNLESGSSGTRLAFGAAVNNLKVSRQIIKTIFVWCSA